MIRLVKLCGLSLLVYVAAFALLLDRPLSLGILRLELIKKTTRLAALPSPKLVILAGSNGPYSHSCVVLRALLNMPCENAGIAVGIGLDDIFTRYAPLLHAGDVVYMPMELDQYTPTAAAYDASVDGAFLLRHDRGVLVKLPWPRQMGAIFCCTLGDFLEALAEMPLARQMPYWSAATLAAEYNRQGDRIDNNLSKRDVALLATAPRRAPSSRAIATGYGTRLIAGFVSRQSQKGVIVIGGLPVDYDTFQLSTADMNAISTIYTGNGGMFTVLPNHSHYPRNDFFNSEDHLVRSCQFLHSIYVARRLGRILHRPVRAVPEEIAQVAMRCPATEAELASR